MVATADGKGGGSGGERSGLERVLGVATEVRAGEGITALLLLVDAFVILTAYYVLKPVREGLILAMEGGANYKAYLGAANAISLLFIVPIYGRFADRYAKDKLVINVTLFFASHLAIFYVLSKTPVEAYLGIVFFVWISVFNMMIVAQFWAFANDICTEEQGKRLFPLFGIGASLGAVVGAWLSSELAKPIGTYQLMLVGMGILATSAILTRVIARREQGRRAREVDPAKEPYRTPDVVPKSGAAGAEAQARAKDDQSGTFALVFRHKYLILIAAFSLLFTLFNANGEYMLGKLVSGQAHDLAHGDRAFARDYTTAFYGDFALYVNVAVFAAQTFLVSRVVKFGGLRVAFFIFPIIALLDASAIAALPILAIVRLGKIAENSADYSINNTVRNMLWLPTTTEMKYKAKQAVDTFFVRMGDLVNGALVFVGSLIGWSVRPFAILNIGLVTLSLFLAAGIIRENARLHREGPPKPAPPAPPASDAPSV